MAKPIPPIDIRDKRLPGGRLKLSSRATSKVEHRRREAAVRSLLDRGEIDVLRRLKDREVGIADVAHAVEAGTIATLRPTTRGDYRLGAQVSRTIQRAPEGSRQNYRDILNRLVRDFGADYPMASMTVDAALEWLHRPRLGDPLRPWSPGRRELARVLCGRLWAEAIHAAEEAVAQHGGKQPLRLNPWKSSGPSRAIKDKIQPRTAWLSRAQWADLLRHVEGTPRAALYALGCLAGLRSAEVTHLRPDLDVDFDARGGRGVVRVQPRAGEYAWKPKGPRSVRDVPMSAELRRILLAHAEAGFSGSRFFIRSPAGDHPLTNRSVVHWTAQDFTAAGLPHGRAGDALTFHSLRHTFASWAVQADRQLLKVAKLLGDTVEVVAEVYGHLMPEDLDDVVDAVAYPRSDPRNGGEV